jgi:DNA repair ATPase RecN
MENKTNPPAEKKSNTNKIWIILFALSAIFNIYQWQNKNSVVESYEMKTDSLMTAKMDVDKELGETYQELNQYKGINERLDSLLAEANTTIDQQKARIEKMLKNEKNSAALNKKLKAELAEIKKLRDEYLEKIDQLLVENEQLKKDKEQLTSTVENLSKNLESTVNQASVLKSEYIKVKTYKKRSNDKYTETAMAKRTNKMEVCFSVLENKIARAGERDVYLRVVEPGGKTMGARSEGSSTFKMANSGEEVQYTATNKMTYDNNKQDQCLKWEEQERVFAPGTYVIELYIDGNLSGASSYVLK